MIEIRLIDANALGRYISDWQMSLPGDNRPDWNNAAYDTLEDVLEAIKNAPTIDSKPLRPQWISTKKMLPEKDMEVLVYTTLYRGTITVATFEHSGSGGSLISREGDRWFLYLGDEGIFATGEEVTHWMPLPEPPKEN